MSSNSISPVWALQETSNSLLLIAKGVMKAATSDNVQPLALVTAEAFGNTLAICQQTQLLVEKEASKHHKSHVINFLKAQIGYAANDSASHLSSTSGGVRFLSLAAALLCTSTKFIAAQALESMIAATSREDQILPTLSQLQDLLESLEYKLVRTGFANSIIGWEDFLTKQAACPAAIRTIERKTPLHPAVPELKALVDAFRTLERIGDTICVRIRATTSCPWIIAFTKWCLGVPAHVVLEDGTVLLDQPSSKVILLAEAKSVLGVVVEVYRDIDNPSELWSGTGGRDTQHLWSGMLSIESFGNRRLRQHGLEKGQGYVVLCKALSYSLKLVKERLRVGRPESADEPSYYGDIHRIEDPATVPGALTAYLPDLWPSEWDICSTLTAFLNLDRPAVKLTPLQGRGRGIRDLPIVHSYIEGLQKSCECKSCSGDASETVGCKIKEFEFMVARTTRDIFALSLFDSVEPVLVSLNSQRDPSCLDDFTLAIRDITLDGRPSASTISAIFNTVLFLCGHKTSEELNWAATTRGESYWIASAYRGQVIYPVYLDSGTLHGQALLKLGGGPGDIQYEGARYNLVVWRKIGLHATLRLWNSVPVDGPKNLLPGEKLEWQVHRGEGCLEIGFGITSTAKSFNPMSVLWNASRSLFISHCPHPKEAPLDAIDINSFFLAPHFDLVSSTISEARYLLRKIGVVAVAGNEGLRFFALAGQRAAVIRKSACLQCCIDICRRTGYTHVVA